MGTNGVEADSKVIELALLLFQVVLGRFDSFGLQRSVHSFVSTVLARLRDGPAGHGFDARTGQVVSMWDAGIVDPVQVLRVALQMAVSAASMALTTEALVLTRKPESEPFGDIGSDTLEP